MQISGIRGSLLGDFSAQRVEVPLPGEGASLRLQDLSWTAPHFRPPTGSLWLRVGFDELRAARVDLTLSDEPSSDTEPPRNLELPVGVEVGTLRVGELHVEGLDTPLRQLRAHLELGADGGALHRLDGVQLSWDKLRLDGRAQVATSDGMAVDAALELSQQPAGNGDWTAALQLAGPLATPQLQATLRAQGVPPRPPQTLDASATLRPFCRLAAGRPAAHRPRAGPVGIAQRRTAHRARLGRVGAHPGPGRAGDRAAVAEQPRGGPLERRLAASAHAGAAAQRPARGSQPAGGEDLRSRARQHTRRCRPDQRQRAVEPGQHGVSTPGCRHCGPPCWTRAPPTCAWTAACSSTAAASTPARPTAQQVDVRGNLDGSLLGKGPAQPVQVRLDARLNMLRIELRELLAQSGLARATLSARLTRPTPSAGWAASGQATLREFDPLPWWPGREDSPWRQGPHRLNAAADFNLQLPASAGSAVQLLSRLRGRAQLGLEPSRLAGVPLSGSLALQTAANGKTSGQLQLEADGNHLRADARLDSLGEGSGDHWDLKADLPTLKKLQPLWKLLLGAGGDARLAGKLNAEASVDGRWPALSTTGKLEGSALQARPIGPEACRRALDAGHARRRAAGRAGGAEPAELRRPFGRAAEAAAQGHAVGAQPGDARRIEIAAAAVGGGDAGRSRRHGRQTHAGPAAAGRRRDRCQRRRHEGLARQGAEGWSCAATPRPRRHG